MRFVVFRLSNLLLLQTVLFGVVLDSYAAPVCQVLDRKASKVDLRVEFAGQTHKAGVENLKAYLWVDPDQPESARLVASLEPKVSHLFGDFEQNPLLIGMLATVLDNELLFRSLSVSKRDSDRYKVKGEVSNGKKTYPADFTISASQIGQTQSRFAADVASDKLEKVIGASGSATCKFDLLFRTRSEVPKEKCSL